MEKFALIVAGGSGSRMHTTVPKQYLELAGKPVLMRTLERFAEYDPQMRFVVVLAKDYFMFWQDLCQKYGFTIDHQLVAGGSTRFQSVRNGLEVLPEEGIVFIHDAVRPLVSLQTIRNCDRMATEKGNALPVLSLNDSLREVDCGGNRHVERSCFRLVQTPQTFRLDLIKKAYATAETKFFTDDASVCEAMGVTIKLVEGNPENIKITRPIDLHMAEYLWKNPGQ